MEVKKIISCNLIFEDGSKMEIEPPASGMILERKDYCGSCGKYIPLHFWIYCPYCGASTVSAKRYQEFLESITRGEDENEVRD